MEKVDKFLYIILKNRNSYYCDGGPSTAAAEFLQKSEETIISFIQNESRSELEFPPLNSFYRRIIHCLGRRYNLVHRVEVTNIFNSNSTLRKIYLTKPVEEQQKQKFPILKSSDWIVDLERESGIIEIKKTKKIRSVKKQVEKTATTPKIKILKRETTATKETPTAVTSQSSSVASSPLLALENLTLEEKEAKYQAARDRIFEGFTATEDAVINEPTCTQAVIDSTSDTITEAVTDSTAPSSTDCTVNIPLSPAGDAHTINTVDANSSTTDYAHSGLNITDHIAISTPRSTALNPDAAPFSFTPVVEEPAPEPIIEINHIYTITATSGQLTRDHLKEILAVHPSCTIKTYTSPTDLAFLLLKDEEINFCVNNEKWTITKWIPEFYLD